MILPEVIEASDDTLQPLPKAEKDAFLAQFRKSASVLECTYRAPCWIGTPFGKWLRLSGRHSTIQP